MNDLLLNKRSRELLGSWLRWRTPGIRDRRRSLRRLWWLGSLWLIEILIRWWRLILLRILIKSNRCWWLRLIIRDVRSIWIRA